MSDDRPVAGLGRSVVVGPGAAAPPDWAGCDREVVSSVDPDLAETLHRAWRRREPLVIELHPGLGLDDPAVPPPDVVRDHQPWEWPVDLDLPAERLHHGVWANSVDARGPGRPARWRWADEAARLGARLEGRDGDVVLPDGQPALCDGGPLDSGVSAKLGIAVVHRVSLEHRLLAPVQSGRPAGSELAADQAAAVSEPLAAARIIAPAGSGKTRVLTDRARLLVDGWGLPPAALALVAYNVRAAAEMRDRLADVGGLRIRTLNALGLRLCGRSTTIDEPEVRRLLGGIVSFPRRAETDPAAPWIEALSRVRLGLAAPEAVEGELPDVSDLDRVTRAYRQQLAERDSVDFDEQVTSAIERLLTDPAFRARSQRYARVLLIDEFQDLTPAHMLLIRLLSGPAGAVFGVGDDDQTIYGYAGATPRWLVDFERWFPGSATHSLEVNYRCPPAVVSAASNLLSRNAVRVAKSIRAAARGAEVAGPEMQVLAPASGTAGSGPARRTVERVESILGEGANPSEIAVLSRVNASLVPVQVLLNHADVPVERGAEQRFLQRSGVRAALAWLEIAVAPGPEVPGSALREAARRPRRAMSNGLLDLLSRPRRFDSLAGLAGWLEAKGSARDAEKVEQFAADVATVRSSSSTTTHDLLAVIRRQVGGGGLDASAGALDRWSHGAIAAHLDDLEALSELAELEPDPQRFPYWLVEQLDAPPRTGGVTLASIHAVKGREWPHVVVHHATDGLMPHRLADDLEEERRVFHVGITRASRTLCIVAGWPTSPFLEELAEPGAPESGRTSRPSANAVASAGRSAPPGTTVPRYGEESKRRRSLDGRGVAAGPGARERSPSGATAPTGELLPAAQGTVFNVGGHEHTVTDTRRDAAVCRLGEGPATTAVPFGTLVSAAGQPALLAHPRSKQAWEQLREWRTTRAKKLGVAPFVVFDDKTLRMVAAQLPSTEAGLLAIRGIGPVKVDTYGSDLLSLCDAAHDRSAEAG